MADINRALIRKVVQRLEHDPRLWCRNGCRDEDGCLCPGALAADLSGGQWAGKAGEELGGFLVAEPGDDPALVLRLIHPHHRARRLFGVDLELGDGLTLAYLRGLTER